MPLMEAISAVGQAIDVAKGMRAVEKNFDAAAYKVQIADLMTALSEARMELVAAREAANEKEAQFEELKRTLTGQSELIETASGFKYKSMEDRPLGLPVCPTCEQRDGRLVFTVKDGDVHKVRCPVCDARFEGIAIYAQTSSDEPPTLAQERARKQAERWEHFNRRLASQNVF